MYPYELMENYRKGTYLEIIFGNRTVRGFFRSWIDYEKDEKALIIDQTYPQHVDFVNRFFPSNKEKAQLFTKEHCPVCNKPMLRNELPTTRHIYWFCRCFGHSFDTRSMIELIERKKTIFRWEIKILNIST